MPSPTKASTMANPMPLAAPVTTAVRPSSRSTAGRCYDSAQRSPGPRVESRAERGGSLTPTPTGRPPPAPGREMVLHGCCRPLNSSTGNPGPPGSRWCALGVPSAHRAGRRPRTHGGDPVAPRRGQPCGDGRDGLCHVGQACSQCRPATSRRGLRAGRWSAKDRCGRPGRRSVFLRGPTAPAGS